MMIIGQLHITHYQQYTITDPEITTVFSNKRRVTYSLQVTAHTGNPSSHKTTATHSTTNNYLGNYLKPIIT
jgi:hypothetical protein